MSVRCYKRELYNSIAQIREELGLTPYSTITNSVEIISQLPILELESIPIQNPSLHGICSFGEGEQADVILLNSNRTMIEQNFDCMHEFIHLHEHRGKQRETFYCYDHVLKKQDSFIEWQANEGAAESLVPYQDFIPRFCTLFSCTDILGPVDICGCLAEYYHVPPRVIDIRLDSLAYEIDQFRKGVPIEEVELLSRNQRKLRGIIPTNYRARIAFPLS